MAPSKSPLRYKISASESGLAKGDGALDGAGAVFGLAMGVAGTMLAAEEGVFGAADCSCAPTGEFRRQPKESARSRLARALEDKGHRRTPAV
jgi:hypothetical protein